jgi:hypothetical protein
VGLRRKSEEFRREGEVYVERPMPAEGPR